ncbi:MAG: enoyl-CoA hydratase/isomerase family protein [Acidimicrobiales bacterium]
MSRSIETGSEHLTCDIDDGVAVITMNRPERRNALTDGMLSGIAHCLAEVETADDVRCVVLTGAGGWHRLRRRRREGIRRRRWRRGGGCRRPGTPGCTNSG